MIDDRGNFSEITQVNGVGPALLATFGYAGTTTVPVPVTTTNGWSSTSAADGELVGAARQTMLA
jgi:hypothetical protein